MKKSLSLSQPDAAWRQDISYNLFSPLLRCSFLILGALMLATGLQAQATPPSVKTTISSVSKKGEPEPVPTSLNLSDFPAASVQDVVVPVPSEIFGVLDKLGNPNWKAQLRLNKTHTPEDRAQIALLLGSVIAEGFVAVEAEDTERVKDLGRDVLNLADAINVRKSVITRCKSIIDNADHRNWRGVRLEFDGALQDVRAAMDEMNDQNLAQLVSLGGWLRGTDVLTAIVLANYTPEGAELLHQPELVHYFNRCIKTMSPRLQKNPLVLQVREVLTQISAVLDEKNSHISREKIQKIHTLTTDVVLKINTTL